MKNWRSMFDETTFLLSNNIYYLENLREPRTKNLYSGSHNQSNRTREAGEAHLGFNIIDCMYSGMLFGGKKTMKSLHTFAGLWCWQVNWPNDSVSSLSQNDYHIPVQPPLSILCLPLAHPHSYPSLSLYLPLFVLTFFDSVIDCECKNRESLTFSHLAYDKILKQKSALSLPLPLQCVTSNHSVSRMMEWSA